MTMRALATALAAVLSAGPVLAEECPEEVPEGSVDRRTLAKKWFTIGEEATRINDDVAALKAYQCSLKFIPHAFTAFNIAQISERVGDLELAVASYNQYLILAPDAKDGDEVRLKVDALKQRLGRVKRQTKTARPVEPVAPAPVEPVPVEPPPVAPDEGAGGSGQPTEAVSERHSRGPNYRTWAWVSYGGAAAFLVGAIVTNRLAQSKMDTCNSLFKWEDPSTRSPAESACADASALAYTSYVFFGVAGVAAAVGTVFVLRPTEDSEVAMTPLPEGGLAFRWGGRF
jgi:predicted RNA-binding protein with TRAM domain